MSDLHVFHVALDDTRHPARFVVCVVAENERAARLALKLSRPFESVAWISDMGTEADYMGGR